MTLLKDLIGYFELIQSDCQVRDEANDASYKQSQLYSSKR